MHEPLAPQGLTRRRLAMALPLAAEDAASGNSAEAGEAASEAALPAASILSVAGSTPCAFR